MTTIKNKSSIVKAIKGNEVIYLSQSDINNGLDIALDMQGYTIITL